MSRREPSAIDRYVRARVGSDAWDDYQERAAIGEFERGMSREAAEREAALLVGVTFKPPT